MAIRIRKVKNKNTTSGLSYIALCAAETKPEPKDLYLDDSIHHALYEKFHTDYVKMGFIKEKKGDNNVLAQRNRLQTY